MKHRYKSYKFWLAIFSAILIVVQNVLSANGVIITDEVGFNIINAVCGLLVFLGVIEKPKKNQSEENNNNASVVKEENNDAESAENNNVNAESSESNGDNAEIAEKSTVDIKIETFKK